MHYYLQCNFSVCGVSEILYHANLKNWSWLLHISLKIIHQAPSSID